MILITNSSANCNKYIFNWLNLKHHFASTSWTTWAYVGQPHEHICLATSMAFKTINPTNQSLKFLKKNIENWRFWKSQFFWVGHFNFFLLHPNENQPTFKKYQRWVKILTIDLIYRPKQHLHEDMQHSVSNQQKTKYMHYSEIARMCCCI